MKWNYTTKKKKTLILVTNELSETKKKIQVIDEFREKWASIVKNLSGHIIILRDLNTRVGKKIKKYGKLLEGTAKML